MSKVYVITGILRNGKRFKPIETKNEIHAMGINLWNGSVFEKDTITGKRKLIKRVVN